MYMMNRSMVLNVVECSAFRPFYLQHKLDAYDAAPFFRQVELNRFICYEFHVEFKFQRHQ